MTSTQLTATQSAAMNIIATLTPATDYGQPANVYTTADVVSAMVEDGVSNSRKAALASLRGLKAKGVAELIANSVFLKVTTPEAEAEAANAAQAAQMDAERAERDAQLQADMDAAVAAAEAATAPVQLSGEFTEATVEAEAARREDEAAYAHTPFTEEELAAVSADLDAHSEPAAPAEAPATPEVRFEDFAKGDRVRTPNGAEWVITQPALDRKTIWVRPVDGGKPIRRAWRSMVKVQTEA